MSVFESGTTAIGLIFPYQSPVSNNLLNRWLDDNGYDKIEKESRQSLSISPTGMKVEGEEGRAKKNDIHILYQASANLNGFSNSSFITAKNTESVNFESVISAAEDIYSWLENDIHAAQDITTVELSIEGLIRVGSHPDLSNYFTTEALQLVETVGGHTGKGITVQFESHAEANTSDWYRLLIDKNAVGNPNLWGFKLTTRYSAIDDIDPESLLDHIDGIINQATGDGYGRR